MDFLRRFVAGERLIPLETALGEALANAVLHGCSDGGSFSVRATANRSCVEIVVCDTGSGFDYDGVTAPDPLSFPTHGMGIALMRGLVDDVRYSLSGSCVTLKMHV